MDLVYGDRSVEVLPARSRLDPGLIGPHEGIARSYDRGGARRALALARDRIGLLREQRAAGTEKLVFVQRSRPDAGNEQLPHARLAAQAHRMAPAIPGVEVADDRDAARVGRPDREAHTLDAADRHRLRPEAPSKLVMRALSDQMQVEFAKQKAKTVRVLGLLNRVLPLDAKLVWAPANHAAREKAAWMGEIESPNQARILARDHFDLLRAWR